jgi:hypothetical protein
MIREEEETSEKSLNLYQSTPRHILEDDKQN